MSSAAAASSAAASTGTPAAIASGAAVAAAAAADKGSSSTQTASGAGGNTTTAKDLKPAASMLAVGDSEKSGTEGQTAQGGESKDGKPADAGELTIKIPEGVEISEADLGAFKAIAKEAGVSSEQASKLVAWSAKRAQEAESAWRKQGEDWFKELETDPDFGKEKLKESQQSVRRAIAKFFDDKLLADLTAYGIDNHPGLVKALKRIGDTLKEDDSATGGGAGNGARASADREAQLRADYPSMYAEQK